MINDYVNGGLTNFKDCTIAESKAAVERLNSRSVSGNMRDVMWLTMNGRLPVRSVVKWSCFVKTTVCPMPDCDEKETVGHLLADCYRSQKVWEKMKNIGLNIICERKTIMYAVFRDSDDEDAKKLSVVCLCNRFKTLEDAM